MSLLRTTIKKQVMSVAEQRPSTSPSPVKPTILKVQEPIVYTIPPVPSMSTAFSGRLGYACLNTILRAQKPPIFCSRTCRLDTVKTKEQGIEYVYELGRQNVRDLLEIIRWNEANNIRFLRISSSLFPYASHSTLGYSLAQFSPLLKQVGQLASSFPKPHRLTTHPGQFVQLGSPTVSVVQSSVRELEYHAEMLDLMEVDMDGVIIVHGGGTYNDKPGTLARLRQSMIDLPDAVRRRIVLENDELCWNAEELLPFCEELDIPLIFDWHHYAIYPSPSLSPVDIISRTNAIFKKRGIKPKQHLSEERRGAEGIMQRRAHADRCQSLPSYWDENNDEVDLMIEAKDKEQAVLHLYRIYGLEEVNQESLRPPVEEETTQTKGRKATKRKKVNAATDEQVDLDKDDAPKEKKGTTAHPVVKESLPKKIRVKKPIVDDEDVEVIVKTTSTTRAKRARAYQVGTS